MVEDKFKAAIAMRELDEETRNRLIAFAGDKVVDIRHRHQHYQPPKSVA